MNTGIQLTIGTDYRSVRYRAATFNDVRSGNGPPIRRSLAAPGSRRVGSGNFWPDTALTRRPNAVPHCTGRTPNELSPSRVDPPEGGPDPKRDRGSNKKPAWKGGLVLSTRLVSYGCRLAAATPTRRCGFVTEKRPRGILT